jgi:protein-L-isoaspartate(D-aspartate) O-methyltransferase
MDTRLDGIGMTSARTRERLIRRLVDQGIRDTAVLERIRTVPRHIFVDEALASRAYEDTALPLGHGQTISQPYIVARMTEALREGGPLRSVLEVGTGCGYQTAVLAGLVPQVFTIERIEPLLQRAKATLRELGISNVRFRHGDGHEGWRAMGPYDGILAAAAPQEVPQELLDELAPGGRLVMPVGPDGQQRLVRYSRRATGCEREDLGAVSFVPMRTGVVGGPRDGGR